MEIKGYTYGYGARRNKLTTPEAIHTQEMLMDIGINWVCLAVTIQQKHYFDTQIFFDFRKNASDLEVIETIERFHKRGIKVCLKPMINTEDGIWRARIDFEDDTMWGPAPYWKEWFEYYEAFLTHYAELAAYTGCEMFCLGCEMLGTERRDTEWRQVIAHVREIYNGPLVYNTNHGKEDKVSWFDAIDYIGTSAYYPVARHPGASKDEMAAEWRRVADHLSRLSKMLGKKVIFMEIGCRSAEGCAMMPWDFTHREFPRSEEEQANFYESCLEVMSGEDWFYGFFWWDWSVVVYDTKEAALRDDDFHIHLKKAEDVVKEWYGKL